MVRSIEDQVGTELAKEHGGRLGFVRIFRPYTINRDDCIVHRGLVENFLLNPSNRYGMWIIELSGSSRPSLIGVRWNQDAKEWERLGRVTYGKL